MAICLTEIKLNEAFPDPGGAILDGEIPTSAETQAGGSSWSSHIMDKLTPLLTQPHIKQMKQCKTHSLAS